MKKTLTALARDTRGNFLEYMILIGLIAIVGVATFGDFGTAIDGKARSFINAIDGL